MEVTVKKTKIMAAGRVEEPMVIILDSTRLETVSLYILEAWCEQTGRIVVRRSGELGWPAQHWAGLANYRALERSPSKQSTNF